MSKRTDAVGDVLTGLLADIENAYPDEGHRIWQHWPEAVGPEIARRAAPLTFRGGRLTVAVSSSPWLQQLSLMTPELIEALNRALGAPVVQKLKFKVAEVVPPAPPPPPELTWRDDPLSDEDQRTAQDAAQGIDDPELAEVMRRARAMALRRLRKTEGG